MKLTILLSLLIFLACKSEKEKAPYLSDTVQVDFVIAFGSCNNQKLPNELWTDINMLNPDVFIWGGDNIYADFKSLEKMKLDYNQVKNNTEYKKLRLITPILGVWDDHDYGLNDGGLEFVKKDSTQQLFLDFFDVTLNDPRRSREGTYHAEQFKIGDKSINIILLDTRFFRTSLTRDPSGRHRYIPNNSKDGSILGLNQWAWLEEQLKKSTADFNIIVSSIQFLSSEHGFETWGNMPNEVKKMEELLISTKANNVIFLSGDRHISEISLKQIKQLNYPLIDFTSSGMTHTYTRFNKEPNKYRITKVVKEKNFGILKINLKQHKVELQIRGKNNSILQEYSQQY